MERFTRFSRWKDSQWVSWWIPIALPTKLVRLSSQPCHPCIPIFIPLQTMQTLIWPVTNRLFKIYTVYHSVLIDGDKRKGLRTCGNCTVRFTPHMRKVSSGHYVSIDTFYSFNWLLVDSEDLDQMRGCAGWSGPSLPAYALRHVFAWRGTFKEVEQLLKHP